MGKQASTLLTEDRFWEIIESSEKGQKLAEVLAKLTDDELFGYRYWWLLLNRKSYNQALWAVAYTVLGGCSDDGFDYFRFWLITRGKAVYYEALRDADTLCDEFDGLTDDEYPEWEDVDYVPMEVYEERTGKDFYDAEETYEFNMPAYPEMEFEWDEEDEESIRKICPRTFDKWWNNDKF